METISVNIPKSYLKAIEYLKEKGLVSNRSEAIRISVRDYIILQYGILKLLNPELTEYQHKRAFNLLKQIIREFKL